MEHEGISEVGGEAKDPQAEIENKSVKALLEEYDVARKFDKNARNQYAIARSFATGTASKGWASDANIIGTFIDILVSFLYAKDPEVSVKAAKNVGGSTKDNADFAETLGIVISRLWKAARLKKKARKQLRSSLSVGPGWLKVIMTHETRRDPVIQKELSEVEDNVNRLNKTIAEIEEGELDSDELVVERKKEELLRESLKNRLEVIFRYALAIDFVQAEDMQVSLDVSDTTEHLDADWNANEIYIPTANLRVRFPRLDADDVKAAKNFYQRKPASTEVENDSYTAQSTSNLSGAKYTAESISDDDSVTFARVIEIWDRRDNHIKTIIDGIKRWAVEPYPPPYASTRFYPYFNLSLFEVDGERHPQSLSSRLRKLQEEYSSKRSNSRLVAERSIPGVIYDSQGVKPEDMRKIEAAVHQEFVGISPTKGDDIRKLFTEKPVAKMDPAIFSTASVMSDMERVAGIQEALSQSVQKVKTATEARIEQAGFASRTGADRDTLEDMLQDLAIYTSELAIQALPAEYVQRLAGDKSFWPEDMHVDDILTLAEVEIQTGSTGKPDEESLRQAWSVLLPLVQQIMVAIQQAQFTNNLPMAEALRNLLKETMRRLDERIDVEQFIPQGGLPDLSEFVQPPGGAPATPATPAAPESPTPQV